MAGSLMKGVRHFALRSRPTSQLNRRNKKKDRSHPGGGPVLSASTVNL